MAKKKRVHNKQEYEKSLAIKGDVRQVAKLAAIQAPSRVHEDRKRASKSGKVKHKGQAKTWSFYFHKAA